MDDGNGMVPARRDDSRDLVPDSPTPRPVLDPEPWKPRRLSAGFAVGFILTVAVLGTITAVWLVGMVFMVILLLLGQGGLGGTLAFAVTGVLLGRGWVGMGQTIRSRLRRRDLADTAALPPVFFTLSPELQRLVRHTRGLRIAVCDPEVTLSEIDRELFEWITAMAALPPEDRRLLADLGLVPSTLREELVASRQQEDAGEREHVEALTRAGSHYERVRRRVLARRPGHRRYALALLDRFEQEVLCPGADPFRGGRAHRKPA